MKKYDKFADLLLKYNKVHKLTGAKSKQDIFFHIEDSLYPFKKLKDISNVLDIGTGAGFPGMVLAIEHPDIHFTLVEPLQKRVAFLYLIKSSYNLQNVTIYQERVENIKPFRVDLITSKAVSDAHILLELSQAFHYNGLRLLLYKGENVHKELKDIKNYEIINKDKTNYLLIRI